MKKFLLIPLIATFLITPLIAQEKTITPEQKLLDEVLADYREGRYNHFLKEMDSTYEEGNKKWEYNTFLEERKKLSTLVIDHETKKPDHLKKEITALHKKQDQELIKACLNHPNEKTSKEVQDMIAFIPNQKEQESINFIHSLTYKFKGDGASPIENKLITIDIEFWLKSISLDVALTQSKVDPDIYQKQHLALQIEKVKQMQEACQGDLVDIKTKEMVNVAASVLPKVYASATTRKHLIALGQGKAAAQNALEEKLQKITANYLDREDALIAKHFPSN